MASAASGTCQAFTPTRTTPHARSRQVVLNQGGANHEVAVHAADPEATLADGGQVAAPGDEPHVLPGLGQTAAEVPADRPGPNTAKVSLSIVSLWVVPRSKAIDLWSVNWHSTCHLPPTDQHSCPLQANGRAVSSAGPAPRAVTASRAPQQQEQQ